MHPATATDVIVTIVFWAAIVFIAGVIFQKVCDLCGADLPSFRRSVLITVLVAAAVFFTFDGTGYGIMLATRDTVNLNLPPGYNYGNWLREPLYLKWQVMGLVPVLRYLPIVFAGCVAATLYVLILAEPFRNCIVILLLQWTLNVVAMAILSFALTNIVHFVAPAQPESAGPGAEQQPNIAPAPPEARAATRPKPHRFNRRPEDKPETTTKPDTPKSTEGEASSGSDLQAALAEHKGNPESSLHQLREQLHALDERAKPYLEPIETACAPYTKYLPEPVQEFLEDGGWWLVFAALAVAVLFWLRALYRRGKRALFHKHRHHKRARRANGGENPLVIDLDLVGDAFSDPGPHQIAVRGQPGRLRLVILAPSAGYAGDLLPEMAESLLDWIQPGLGEIVASDSPRVVVWPRHPSVGQFAEMFHKLVQAPEVKGRRSPWVLLSGAAHLGRQTVFLGLGVFLDKTTYQREIEVAREKWGEVLSVQKVTEPV
jgi:hypothetical protein